MHYVGVIVAGILVVAVGGGGVSALAFSYWDDWQRRKARITYERNQARLRREATK